MLDKYIIHAIICKSFKVKCQGSQIVRAQANDNNRRKQDDELRLRHAPRRNRAKHTKFVSIHANGAADQLRGLAPRRRVQQPLTRWESANAELSPTRKDGKLAMMYHCRDPTFISF